VGRKTDFRSSDQYICTVQIYFSCHVCSFISSGDGDGDGDSGDGDFEVFLLILEFFKFFDFF
jgi:hypothetical protein